MSSEQSVAVSSPYPSPPGGWSWRFGKFKDGWQVVARMKSSVQTDIAPVSVSGCKSIEEAAAKAMEMMA
jgi:hypothetical protein